MTNPKMPEPTGEYAKVPPGWPPQTWGAHLAKIEYMKEMGHHYSFTGAERNVRKFRTKVKEECVDIIKGVTEVFPPSERGIAAAVCAEIIKRILESDKRKIHDSSEKEQL